MPTRRCRRPTAPIRWRRADLDLLATAASLIGRMDEYLALLERAHLAHIERGENLAAARSAGWLGMTLAIRGELGPASGWFGRAQRLVEREGRRLRRAGWLLVPVVFQREAAGDYDGAHESAAQAIEIAERFGDSDLAAIALHAQGVVRIKQGSLDEGLRLLDEAMVGVTADSVSPVVAGIVYCGVIAGCEEAFEVRRATGVDGCADALVRRTARRWSRSRAAALRIARGLMQLHGEWRDALAEAKLARERCEKAMNRAATGQALYQQGELHRLQGDFEAAEAAYRGASDFGREPQPGPGAPPARPGRRRGRRRDDSARSL